MRRLMVILVAGFVVAACRESTAPGIARPENLTYDLQPSGDPAEPAGILLRWDAVTDPGLEVYRVFSRPGQSGAFGLRASTTSTTFHDRGRPDLEYFVVAVNSDGRESAESDHVIVDERLRLQAPNSLSSITLSRAIHLLWSDNPYTAAPNGFKQYRVYSTGFSLDDGLCDPAWRLEGTTVAPEFLVGAITNGVPLCFGVSAESIEGFESLWSPLRADTPRPDARNIVMAADQFDPSMSGFRFWLDANGDGAAGASELGLVRSGALANNDFVVSRDVNGNFFFVPLRANTTVALYGTQPIADLTSIDVAPVSGYSRVAIQALPRFGYVFQMDGGDGFARFGGIRVTHVGRDFVIFDWSYQTDPGNPELSVGAGIFTAGNGGLTVVRQ